jgi:hypothetical protein
MSTKGTEGVDILIDSEENWHYFYRNQDTICRNFRTLSLPSLSKVIALLHKFKAQNSLPEKDFAE